MKTSTVLASLLFGSFAAAAPFDRRALVYKTEVVTETVIVYTTVYDDELVSTATTTSEGAFYEQPKPTSTVVKASSLAVPTSSAAPAPAPVPTSEAVPSSSAAPAPVPTSEAVPSSSAAPAYAPSVPAEEPSSVSTPPAPETPTPTPEPTTEPIPEPTPEPQPEPEAPQPATTEEVYTPAPASISAAQFSNVDMTIYDNNGGFGACGKELYDDMMVVALAQSAWGASTYDTMTGEATNPWCGQKIKIDYEGNSIEATIMDMCPGCSGNDIDLSLKAWKTLTGLDEKTRVKASWSKID